jgi:hypothetical protein
VRSGYLPNPLAQVGAPQNHGISDVRRTRIGNLRTDGGDKRQPNWQPFGAKNQTATTLTKVMPRLLSSWLGFRIKSVCSPFNVLLQIHDGWYHINVRRQNWLHQENAVARQKAKLSEENGRPKRRKLSAEESLQRMKEFDKRKESFIGALRKSKNRGVSS